MTNQPKPKTVSLDSMLRERLQEVHAAWNAPPRRDERVPMQAMLGPDGSILVGITRRKDRGPTTVPRYHLVDRVILDGTRHTCGEACEGCTAVEFAVALLLEEVASLRHRLQGLDKRIGGDPA